MTLRRFGRWLAALAAAALIAAGAFWAGRASLSPPSEPAPSTREATFRVDTGEVGRSLKISVLATRSRGRELRLGTSGTVTTIDTKPRSFSQGDVLAAVNLRPSVIAEGAVPSFRDLQYGDAGADVRQLQAFLGTLGSPAELTGLFDVPTLRRVTSWQQSLGLPATGVVARSDLVYLPALPAIIEPLVAVGDQVAPDTPIARQLSDKLSFTSSLPPTTVVSSGAPVAISFSNGTWPAAVTGIHADDPSAVTLVIGEDPGGPPCAQYCASLEGAGPFDLPGLLVLVPPRQGPVVPVAAIATDAAGRQSVTMADGSTRPVEVLAAYGGLAVIDGVSVGESIKLPSTP